MNLNRKFSFFLLTISISTFGCSDDGVEPAADEAATESGECMPGLQGCECYLGFCEQDLECVGNYCVDPECQLGSEQCPCAEGDLCFSGLECVDGLCKSSGAEGTTDGTTTDGTTTDGTTTDEGCSPNAYTQCVGESVTWFDSCGVMGGVSENCTGSQVCINTSESSAECQQPPITCGNGQIDPGEDCDGNLINGGNCMGEGFDGGTLACGANCQYDTGGCYSCQCNSGPCCDSCNYFGANTLCEPSAQTEYGCPNGSDPGDDVSVRTRGQYCSGTSDSCDGALGNWGGWSVADACTDNEYCSPGDSTCNPCTYDVTQYECQTFSAAGGGGGGGGEIFQICASTNAQGYMTVKARKLDNSTFSNRPYQVRVSAPADDPCGPATNYFTISDSDPVGIGTNELTFEFQSVFLAGQTQKAYCVTASTKAGDVGYDANNPQQQSWWYSKKSILAKLCG